MRSSNLTALALLPAALAGCDDGGTTPEGPNPEDVAGIYAICQLAFVPEGGTLAQVDLRAVAFETANPAVQQPQLRVDRNRQVELVYTPKGGFVSQDVRGTVQLGVTQVTLQFDESGRVSPRALLLPERLPLTFREEPRSLEGTSTTPHPVPRADYARLSGQSEANLADPIRGSLTASFRDVLSGSCP